MNEIDKSDTNPTPWSLKKLAVDRAREGRRRSRRKWLRRAIWSVLLVAATVFLAVAVAPKPLPVDVTTVRRGAMTVTVDEAGRARVRIRFVVTAPFAGTLGRLELRPGDVVREGHALATVVPSMPALLDPRARAAAEARLSSALAVHRQSEAARRRAELALEDAQRELRTTGALAASGSVSTETLARARVEARMREEEVASARFAAQVAVSGIAAERAALGLFDPRTQRTETFVVRAPISGRVLRVLHPDAGSVAPGTPLLEVGDPSALEVVVDVLTADAARISDGAPATLEAWGGAPLAAHVRRVEPSAFTRLSALGVEEQRVSVILDLDAPRDTWAALADGWRVEARIVVWSEPDTLVVPSGALFRSGDGWATFVVDGGRASRRSVTIGQRSGTEVQVTGGLVEGAATVVHPSERIADGSRVAPR